tara:strand:- start:426 stop:1019 length:594 start_codon:yes stop_codon:yes gene_type:complete
MTPSRKRNQYNSTQSQSKNSLPIKILLTAIIIVSIGIISIVAYSMQSDSEEIGFQLPLREGLHSPPYIYTLDILVDDEPKRIPPTSGNHFEMLSRWGFLGAPLVPENVVHNMEHGGVVLWYQPNQPKLAGSVNQLIEEIGQKCMVAGSYKDMSYAIAATVWGRILPLENFDAEEIKEFISKYRGSQGPEAPLCKSQS